jgi:hypothetical protein
MSKINSAADLRNAILELESKRTIEEKLLREQIHLAYESIKPVNLIKSTFKEAAASLDLKENILNTSVGLTAGFFSKILFEGVTKNPLKKLLGTALMFGITNIVAKNPDTVKSLGNSFLKIIRSKPEKRITESDKSETR